jgi:hypothetical protein
MFSLLVTELLAMQQRVHQSRLLLKYTAATGPDDQHCGVRIRLRMRVQPAPPDTFCLRV